GLPVAAGGRGEPGGPGGARGLERPSEPAQTQPAVASQLAADVESGAGVTDIVGGETAIPLKQVDHASLQLDPRRDEEILLGVEWLIELAGERRRLTDLQIVAPLGAQRVDPRPAIARQQIEEVVALEVAREPQTEA